MERINVTRSSMPGYEEYCAEICQLWDSRWLTNMGSKHQQLEQDYARNILPLPVDQRYGEAEMARIIEEVSKCFN